MRSGHRINAGRRMKRHGVDKFGALRLLGRRAPIVAEEQMMIGLKTHLAVKSLRDKRGSQADMVRLAYALNVALMLCELGICKEHIPAVLEAQKALLASASRSRELGEWTLDEPFFSVICVGLEIHDAQLGIASQTEVVAAEREIACRAARGDVTRTETVA